MSLSNETFSGIVDKNQNQFLLFESPKTISMNQPSVTFNDSHAAAVLSNVKIIDEVLKFQYMTHSEKSVLLQEIFQIMIRYNMDIRIYITSKTITNLLQQKNGTDAYFELYSLVISFCKSQEYYVFEYQHLYNLVLQMWMDNTTVPVNNDERKQMILCAFDEHIPESIFDKIREDIDSWFSNLGKNADITEMVEWLCSQEESGDLLKSKILYEKTIKETMEESKMFQKIHNMTKEEYEVQQEKAKKNGLCKFIRENHNCPNGVNCIFFHGKIEETYGIQPCRNGAKCSHLERGECKFVHAANNAQYLNTLNFYQTFWCAAEGTAFYADSPRVKNIDHQIKYNPFIILKKEKMQGKHIKYHIPMCPCTVRDSYGLEQCCNKPVKFMIKKEGNYNNFYCSYEHMEKMEPGCSFVVKQNIMDHIMKDIIEYKKTCSLFGTVSHFRSK